MFGILLLTSLLLLLPPVQKWIVQETVDYIESSIGTKVELKAIYFSWPNGVSLEKLYLEDQNGDTLLYSDHLHAGIDYKALLHAEIEIGSVEIHHSVVNIRNSEKDSLFNFDYIIKAFSPADTSIITPADTTPMDIDIGDIEILKSRFSYVDELSGMQSYLKIDEFYLEVDEFDISKNVYLAEEILLKNSSAKIVLTKSTEAPDTTNKLPLMTVGSLSLNIENSTIEYISKVDQLSLSSHIGSLQIDAEPIKLNSQRIAIESILLDNSKLVIHQGTIENLKRPQEKVVEETKESTMWKISLAELDVNKLSLGYLNENTKRQQGLDYGKLNLALLHANISNIYFNAIDDLGAEINKLSLKESSGLQIKEFTAELQIEPTQLQLQNVLLRTSNSLIQRNFILKYSSFEKLTKNPENLFLDVDIKDSKIAWNDLLYFLPDLASDSSMEFLRSKNLFIDTRFKGKINHLEVEEFLASLGGSTVIRMKGTLKGLADIKNLWIDLPFLDIQTTAIDLKNLLAPNTIPSNIQLPSEMSLMANIEGNFNQMQGKLDLRTSLGNMLSNFSLQSEDTSWQNASYVAEIVIPTFRLDRLLSDSLFGSFSFDGNLKGKGLTAENVYANILASVSEFEYADYLYSDLDINGILDRKKFTGHLEMNDSNLVFSFDGEANLDSNHTVFHFKFNLEGADLQHLKLHEEDVRLRGKITADIEGNKLNELNGNLDLRDFLIIYNGRNYSVDSLLFVSIVDSGKTNISIESTILSGSFKGTINLAEIVPTLKDHFYSYLGPGTSVNGENSPQDFTFELKVKDEDIITDIILPDLHRFVSGDINGSYDSEKRKLDLKIYFPLIEYKDFIVDSLYLTTDSDHEKMNFTLNVNKMAFDTLSINNIVLRGHLANDSLHSKLSISEDNGIKKFQLAAIASGLDDNILHIKILDNTIFDYTKWHTSVSNEILLGEKLEITGLTFSKDQESLNISTLYSDNRNYLQVDFQNFQLANFADIISSYKASVNKYGLLIPDSTVADTDTLHNQRSLLTAIVNGNIRLPLNSSYALLADIHLEDLEISERAVGNIHLIAKEINADQQLVSFSLSGQGNELELEGNLYHQNKNTLLDLNARIKKLNLKSIEPFVSDQFKNTNGYFTGAAEISGSSSKPIYSGSLSFHQVELRTKYLGTIYNIPSETIHFSNSEISVDNFTVYDSLKNSFILDGSANIEKINNPQFDLSVKSNSFILLNTTKESDNDLFYGKIIISSDMHIGGDLDHPLISADMMMENGSDLTFIVPENEAVSVNQEGIVEFVDKDSNLPELLSEEKNIDTVKMDVLGMDLTAYIEVDPSTNVKIVIDPITGDHLILKGGGKFKSLIDPSGNISLFGMYEIEEGSYELRLYNLVRRNFDIQAGSNIIWNGNILDAKMDIRAIYKAKAAPIDLLGNQLTQMSAAQQGMYRQKLDFEVIMNLNGELMQPQISFKLDLSEDDKGAMGGIVIAKLNEINLNPSELNKQVFALLVLKRFISQDPFESSGGAGENVARQSVSRLMNQQLNKLIGDDIKGFQIELNIDSYEDYNTEGEQIGRTQLGLALSKSLFNERITVNVNNDFDVEGETVTANSQNNVARNFAGDISVEYLITEDGRYRIKVFRDNKYSGIIEGQLIETGISFIFAKDYQHFRDLFKKKNEVEESENKEVVQ